VAPTRGFRVRRSGFDADPVGEGSEHAAVRATARRTTYCRESLAGHDRASRLSAVNQHAEHDPSTQRIATEVVVIESELIDQGKSVVGQNIGRVAGRIVWSGAVTVAADIRKDDAVATLSEGGGGSLIEPLQCRAVETMKQYQWAAVPYLTVGQFQAITASESMHARLTHIAMSSSFPCVEAVDTTAGEDVIGGGQHLTGLGGVQGSVA
jgi:hypothetical protein